METIQFELKSVLVLAVFTTFIQFASTRKQAGFLFTLYLTGRFR
jgi:hypothetical protein